MATFTFQKQIKIIIKIKTNLAAKFPWEKCKAGVNKFFVGVVQDHYRLQIGIPNGYWVLRLYGYNSKTNTNTNCVGGRGRLVFASPAVYNSGRDALRHRFSVLVVVDCSSG